MNEAIQSHSDAIHAIALQAANLVMDEGRRAYFVGNIERLCDMAEEYGKHVQRCLDDPELRIDEKLLAEHSRLKKEIDKLQKCESWASFKKVAACLESLEEDQQADAQLDNLIWNKSVQLDKVDAKIDTPPEDGCERVSLSTRLLNDWKFFKLTRPEPYCLFWERQGPVNPLLWFGLCSYSSAHRLNNNDEWLLMRDCFLLAAIHDSVFQDKADRLSYQHELIFSEQYDGKCFRRDKFVGAVFRYYDTFDTEKDSNERLSDLDLAFGRVEEGFKKAGSGQPAEAKKQKRGSAAKKKAKKKRTKSKSKAKKKKPEKTSNADAYIPFKDAIELSNGVLTRKKLEKAMKKGEPLKVRYKKPSPQRSNVHIQDTLALIKELSSSDDVTEKAIAMFSRLREVDQERQRASINLD